MVEGLNSSLLCVVCDAGAEEDEDDAVHDGLESGSRVVGSRLLC